MKPVDRSECAVTQQNVPGYGDGGGGGGGGASLDILSRVALHYVA